MGEEERPEAPVTIPASSFRTVLSMKISGQEVRTSAQFLPEVKASQNIIPSMNR